LVKENDLNFVSEHLDSFSLIKNKLVNALVRIAPNWDIHFELMCDASDCADGVVMGQLREIFFMKFITQTRF